MFDELTDGAARIYLSLFNASPRPGHPVHASIRIASTGASMQQRVAATRRVVAPVVPPTRSASHTSLVSRPSQPPRTVHRTRQRRSHAVVSAASTDGQAARPSGPRICVLGGGFGGLYAALRLESLPWPQGGTPEVCEGRARECVLWACAHKQRWGAAQVTLVDRSPRFTFKPLLYELLTGQLEEEQARRSRGCATSPPRSPPSTTAHAPLAPPRRWRPRSRTCWRPRACGATPPPPVSAQSFLATPLPLTLSPPPP